MPETVMLSLSPARHCRLEFRVKISSLRDPAFFRRVYVKRFAGPRFSAASREVRSTREIGADLADLSRISHARIQTACSKRPDADQLTPAKISRFARAIWPFVLFCRWDWWIITSLNEVCQLDFVTRINTFFKNL